MHSQVMQAQEGRAGIAVPGCCRCRHIAAPVINQITCDATCAYILIQTNMSTHELLDEKPWRKPWPFETSSSAAVERLGLSARQEAKSSKEAQRAAPFLRRTPVSMDLPGQRRQLLGVRNLLLALLSLTAGRHRQVCCPAASCCAWQRASQHNSHCRCRSPGMPAVRSCVCFCFCAVLCRRPSAWHGSGLG